MRRWIDRQLAKYSVAFLNRQFINIMCANGIPKQLFIDLFEDAVFSIRGLRSRVALGAITDDDWRLMSLCSEVCYCSIPAFDSQFPLSSCIKAGWNTNPHILDIISIIECRTLQDLKWRARVKLQGGVFLIGEHHLLRTLPSDA